MAEANVKLARVLAALQNLRINGRGTKPLPKAAESVATAQGAASGSALPDRIRPRPVTRS